MEPPMSICGERVALPVRWRQRNKGRATASFETHE